MVKNRKETYGYFLGCVMPAKMPWAEKAVITVSKALDLDFHYLKGTLCCVRPGVWKPVDYDGWLTLTAYNLALAEEQNVTLVDTCNGCWLSHYETWTELKEEPEKLKMADKYLSKTGRTYKGTINVKHWLQVLYEDVGLEKIKASIKKQLPIRVTRHAGCHCRKLGDDVIPRYFDEILEALDVEILDTGLERMCCGLLQFLADPDFSIYQRVKRKFDAAESLGADAIVFFCSGCYDQFDRAISILRAEGKKYTVPSVHLAELIALAFGFKPEDFGMTQLRPIPVDNLIKKIRG